MRDVWEMFQIIMDERKKREIDPTMAVLRECLAEIESERSRAKSAPQVRERLQCMLAFFDAMSSWYTQIRRLPPGAVIRFVKMGRRVQKLLGV